MSRWEVQKEGNVLSSVIESESNERLRRTFEQEVARGGVTRRVEGWFVCEPPRTTS